MAEEKKSADDVSVIAALAAQQEVKSWLPFFGGSLLAIIVSALGGLYFLAENVATSAANRAVNTGEIYSRLSNMAEVYGSFKQRAQDIQDLQKDLNLAIKEVVGFSPQEIEAARSFLRSMSNQDFKNVADIVRKVDQIDQRVPCRIVADHLYGRDLWKQTISGGKPVAHSVAATISMEKYGFKEVPVVMTNLSTDSESLRGTSGMGALFQTNKNEFRILLDNTNAARFPTEYLNATRVEVDEDRQTRNLVVHWIAVDCSSVNTALQTTASQSP